MALRHFRLYMIDPATPGEKFWDTNDDWMSSDRKDAFLYADTVEEAENLAKYTFYPGFIEWAPEDEELRLAGAQMLPGF